MVILPWVDDGKQQAKFSMEYAHNAMAAILVFKTINEASMLLYQTNPVGVQLFSYVNTFFCSAINLHGCCTRECMRSIFCGKFERLAFDWV